MGNAKRPRDIYIAIKVAAAKGSGISLTWQECADLALDDAIETVATNNLTDEERAIITQHGFGREGWRLIDPFAVRNES